MSIVSVSYSKTSKHLLIRTSIIACNRHQHCECLLLCRASSLQSLTPEQTRCSSIVSSEVLLGHRILMLFISWGLGLTQVIQRGRMIFTFFTVWNWWLLMLYFAFATMSTLKVVWERRKKSARSSSSRRRLTFGDEDYGSIGWIDRITVTLFQVVVPVRR